MSSARFPRSAPKTLARRRGPTPYVAILNALRQSKPRADRLICSGFAFKIKSESILRKNNAIILKAINREEYPCNW